MNSENIKTFDPHRQQLYIPDKTNLKGNDKYVAWPNTNIYYTWKTKRKRNEFKLSAPTREEKFELSGRSYSVLDM